MNPLLHSRLRSGVPLSRLVALLLTVGCLSLHTTGVAQDSPTPDADPPAAAEDYVSALELLPETTAGIVRIPDLPASRAAWDETNFGKLADDPLVQPFIDAMRTEAEAYLDSTETTVGLKPKDLCDIASGEVVAAWLPFEKDRRRPYSLCVVADIRGRAAATAAAVKQIDADLKAGDATRKDVQHLGQTIRVYSLKPKPGQLKLEQIALTWNDTRIIAADRAAVVIDLLSAIAGEPPVNSLADSATFQTVIGRAKETLAQKVDAESGTVGFHWYARPFQMGRILREIFEVDRGNQVDVVQLLENQGFDAIKAAGGIMKMGVGEFDLVHFGYILAPPAADGPVRFQKAAQMLQFIDRSLAPIPAWVHEDVASFSRLNWKLEEAFWASETLVDEAFGDEIFQPMIEGIREDEEGPQIDLAKDLLPNLDDQIILINDNVLPAGPDSDRMLVAVRVQNADVIERVVRQAMEVEPDATQMDVLPGVQIWRVQRSATDDEFQGFDDELFDDLALEDEAPSEEAPPLLDQWAIALVRQGPGSKSAYLMFSSHPDLLTLTAKRIQQGATGGMGSVPAVAEVTGELEKLAADKVIFDRVLRLKLSLRTKYELLRQGKLRESDSVLATVVRRILEEDEEEPSDQNHAAKLPPIGQIEKYLQPGGAFIEMTDEGWTLNGFFLK